MRVHVFTEHFPNTYKPYFDTQFTTLLDQGHELHVFAFGRFDASLPARTVAYGLPGRTTYLPLTLRSLPAFAGKLASTMTTRGARVGLCWRRDRPLNRNLPDAARALLLPQKAPDLCLIHNLVAAQYFGFLRRIWPATRVALYFHGGEVPGGGAIDAEATREAFASVDRVFTNTGYSRDLAVARGCPPGKIVICPVGFRIDDYVPAADRRVRPDGVLRLLSVGRVSVEKGFEHAVEAARMLLERGHAGKFRYTIVGDGPRSASLRDSVQRSGLAGHVVFRGELANDHVRDEYRDADVLVLPSIRTDTWEENQACVAQEAMLMKLPVLGTRTGGIQESIAPELRNLGYEPADPRALANRLEQLLALDDAAIGALGDAARRFAERSYDIRPLTEALLAEAMRGASDDARAAA